MLRLPRSAARRCPFPAAFSLKVSPIQPHSTYIELNTFFFWQVGNGFLTLNEQQSHFAIWAILKSPLLVGADLRFIRKESLEILLAKEIIAINQDALGVAGDLVWKLGPYEVRPTP